MNHLSFEDNVVAGVGTLGLTVEELQEILGTYTEEWTVSDLDAADVLLRQHTAEQVREMAAFAAAALGVADVYPSEVLQAADESA